MPNLLNTKLDLLVQIEEYDACLTCSIQNQTFYVKGKGAREVFKKKFEKYVGTFLKSIRFLLLTNNSMSM